MARWEALLLPDWTWEAYRKADDGLYFGRVKSPKTYDNWEYGYFSRDQLEEAGAYRVDVDIRSEEDLFPDGGYLADIYETELEALLKEAYHEEKGDPDH